jgi:hypothetical protein
VGAHIVVNDGGQVSDGDEERMDAWTTDSSMLTGCHSAVPLVPVARAQFSSSSSSSCALLRTWGKIKWPGLRLACRLAILLAAVIQGCLLSYHHG